MRGEVTAGPARARTRAAAPAPATRVVPVVGREAGDPPYPLVSSSDPRHTDASEDHHARHFVPRHRPLPSARFLCRGARRRAGPATGRPAGLSDHGPRGPPQPRPLQGDDQGAHELRRPPPGHQAQPRRCGLDRGPAQELWVHRRPAADVHLHAARGPRARAGRAWTWRRPWTRSERDRFGRRPVPRPPGSHRREQRLAPPARSGNPRDGHRADARYGGRAAGGLLHEGRHHASRGDATSWAATWTASAGGRPPTTTARAPRW